VGPADAFFYDPPKHTRFRILEIRLTIINHALDKAKTELVRDMLHPEAVAAHGAVAVESESSLAIDWKPDWLQCGFATKLKKKHVDPARPERALSPVQFIVLHHNDATTPGSTLDHFSDTVNNTHKTGAHYLVDVDGHVIKMAHETVSTNHAGRCFWYGLDSHHGPSNHHMLEFSWNDISVGIEQVNKDSNKYPIDLVAGAKNLVERIRSFYKTSPHNVLGHGEISLHRKEPKRLGNKLTCPGEGYDWTLLENNGNATKPAVTGGVPHARYADFFVRYRQEALNVRIDTSKKPKEEVEDIEVITTMAVAGLQRTLSELGYFVNFTSKYDEVTTRAVEAFQVRYFSGRFRKGERERIVKDRTRLANLRMIERMHEVLAARGGFRY
jgi:N-acetyl-anhydromuramyl-L-alanine amidase AmpD